MNNMERIRDKNINTPEYWNEHYANDAALEADKNRGGNKCKFASVLEELTELRSKMILDIGCFNGNFYNFLFNSGRDVKKFTGIDHSEKLISMAKNRFPRHEWIISDYSKLPFENNIFDIVTAMEILEHVDNPDKLIEEAFRVCKESGIVIVTVPNRLLVDDQEHVWKYETSDIFNLLSKYSTNIKVFQVCSTNRTIVGKAIKGYKPYL